MLYGEKHRELREWLAGSWWSEGSPVCVVGGFPGSGKTEIALQAMDMLKSAGRALPVIRCNCIASHGLQIEDFLMMVAQELAAVGDVEPLERLKQGEGIATIAANILALPRLIVADEAQQLVGQGGTMPTPMANLLEQWSHAAGAQGRLLLLSNREFTLARWSERIVAKRLDPLDEKDAAFLLRVLLENASLGGSVPPGRVGDVVNWLGRNPRAIKLLVSALARETLDDLIGLAAEAWEARERRVSPALLEGFERMILERAEERLDAQARTFLARLSVLRQPVELKALQALNLPSSNFEPLRDELIARFMLDLRRNRYEMHPVLRETVRLRMRLAHRRAAHLAAGRFYARPFRAQRALGKAEQLGARFIEARYHFTQAESEADLDDISQLFEAHYRSQFGPQTPVPSDPQELDERITLLSALLQARGAMGLEYHLACCLFARRRVGDIGRALPHARRATGPQSSLHAWVLRIRLEDLEFGSAQALKVAREAIDVLAETMLQPIYSVIAEILAADRKWDEAIDILQQGIDAVPPQSNLYALYIAAAEILSARGEQDRALELLLEGEAKVPPGSRLDALFYAAGKLLSEIGRPQDAVAHLRLGIERVPAQSRIDLYRLASQVLSAEGRNGEAVELIQKDMANLPEKGRSTLKRVLDDLRSSEANAAAATVHQANAGPTARAAVPRLKVDAEQLLMAMRPDRWFGLYVLGCYDRKKTLYTQQSRALALVRAMFQTGELTPGGRLAVVGGGAGGVAAAAAAAVKGAKVVLYERAENLLPLQRQNTKRYLHPHLFDWPEPQSYNSAAGLPILNWRADYSDKVAFEIEAGFKRIVAEKGNVTVQLGTSVQEFEPIMSSDQTRRVRVIGEDGSINEVFDSVILAIGFGIEPRTRLGIDSPPYWEDDGLNQALGASSSRRERILVSGAGDGALIDLLRATIVDFRHDRLVEMLPKGDSLLALTEAVRDLDQKARRKASLRVRSALNLQEMHAQIAMPKEFEDKVAGFIRRDTEICFNFESPSRYTMGSSALHRVMISLLIKLGAIRPKMAPLKDGSIVRLPDGTFSVAFRSSEPAQIFDRIVLRHGPPADYLTDLFPTLGLACAPLRGKLQDLELTGALDDETLAFFTA